MTQDAGGVSFAFQSGGCGDFVDGAGAVAFVVAGDAEAAAGRKDQHGPVAVAGDDFPVRPTVGVDGGELDAEGLQFRDGFRREHVGEGVGDRKSVV